MMLEKIRASKLSKSKLTSSVLTLGSTLSPTNQAISSQNSLKNSPSNASNAPIVALTPLTLTNPKTHFGQLPRALRAWNKKSSVYFVNKI